METRLANRKRLIVAWMLLVTRLTGVDATKYRLQKDYTANGVEAFFESFNFYDGPDPTNGYVRYLDRTSAVSEGLAGYMSSSAANATHNSIYIAVEHSSMATPPGRASVRISSRDTYGSGALFVADILHHPGGICGTWPALWLLGAGANWPYAGELDIFEQVSLASHNSVTAHTGPACALPAEAPSSGAAQGYKGTLVTGDCNVDAPDQPTNAGCSIDSPPSPASFGAPFNAAGGGVYITEWTVHRGFNVWFVPRASVADIRGISSDKGILDTRRFGQPVARFSGSGCDWGSSFREMRIMINTALCGDWAGGAWDNAEAGGCASRTGAATCEEYVAANPSAFVEAYWEIGSLRVYSQLAE